MSYRFLHNPKSPEYLEWKSEVLSPTFPWYWNQSTAGPVSLTELGLTADDDTSFWGHCVLSRPDSAPYWDGVSSPVCSELFEQTVWVMNEIATINNISFQPIRLAFNCVVPGEVPMSIPHVDHYFPHDNFLIYLSEFTGGNTWLEGLGEVEPEEDMILMFNGDVRHAGCRPTGSNERRVVFVATSGFVPEHKIQRSPNARDVKTAHSLEWGSPSGGPESDPSVPIN